MLLPAGEVEAVAVAEHQRRHAVADLLLRPGRPAPHRVAHLLEDLARAVGERRDVVVDARESGHAPHCRRLRCHGGARRAHRCDPSTTPLEQEPYAVSHRPRRTPSSSPWPGSSSPAPSPRAQRRRSPRAAPPSPAAVSHLRVGRRPRRWSRPAPADPATAGRRRRARRSGRCRAGGQGRAREAAARRPRPRPRRPRRPRPRRRARPLPTRRPPPREQPPRRGR